MGKYSKAPLDQLGISRTFERETHNVFYAIILIMNPIENLKKLKQEFEETLPNFGNAMVLVDNFNNITYTNSNFLRDFEVEQGELIGNSWTTVTKAFEYKEGVEILPEERSSEIAVITNTVSVNTFYLKIRENPKLFLVMVTAIPLLLNGEVAGGILVLKSK